MTHDGLREEQLVAWGEAAGAMLERPAFITLRGELGAGKSVLARAIARGAGVTSPMPSPTYNLLFRYATPRGDVVHLDLYRLESEEDVIELGWRELGTEGDIVLVEWPERAASLLPVPRWDVTLAEAGTGLRSITLDPVDAVPPPPPLPPLPR